MPSRRWIGVSRPVDPNGACTIFAARLPLRSYRQMPRLLWLVIRIRSQLRASPGILGYAFDLDMRHKTLWTISAWSHRAGLARFERTGAHSRAKHTCELSCCPHVRGVDLSDRSAARVVARDPRAHRHRQSDDLT